ncbi:MAG: hypothetical protein SF182_11195 [Deltaproteobacteria bacterium]|nr:hypothetical protein [Deltaproteobacteria bacterium]
MRGRLAAAAALLAVAALFACGRKTPVRPPEAVAPVTIADLSAHNATAGITLAWRRPTESADGAALWDLDRFVVERAAGDGPFEFLVLVPVLDRNKLRQQKRFRYVDGAVEVGSTYQYRVRSVTIDDFVSPPSNVASIERAIPTATPIPEPTATPTPL